MDRAITYCLHLKETWSDITNYLIGNTWAKDHSEILDSIRQNRKLQMAVRKELDRYIEMRPQEARGYVKTLIADIDEDTRWPRNSKTEAIEKRVKEGQPPGHIISWYKIIAPWFSPGAEEMDKSEVVSAYYYHLQSFKEWLDHRINGNQSINHIEKPSKLGVALLHYYWYKHSKEKSVLITKTNVEKWRLKYGLNSSVQLLKMVAKVEKDQEPATGNKISQQEFAKQYSLILPLLEAPCPAAYKEVFEKLKRLTNINPSLL